MGGVRILIFHLYHNFTHINELLMFHMKLELYTLTIAYIAITLFLQWLIYHSKVAMIEFLFRYI